MAIDIAIAGAAVIAAGNAARNNANSPTCTIQMHDGTSSKGLECIVRPIHEMSNGEFFLFIGGFIGLLVLFFGTMALLEMRAEKNYKEKRKIEQNYQARLTELYAKYDAEDKKKKKKKSTLDGSWGYR